MQRLIQCKVEKVSDRVADMRTISKQIAWLCIVLAFSSALAFAVHQHSSATEAAKCTVCVAAHSTSPKAPCKLPKVEFVPASASLVPQVVSAQQLLIAFALSVRPPPIV
jgi:hypothetical protein